MAENDELRHPKTDDEKLRKVKQMRADGLSGSANFFDRMAKAEDFVIGLQWEPGIKEQARVDGKFTLTIPIVKPQIKQIAGQEIQNPQDFIVENTREGTATVARILTALTKQAADSERVRYEKSQMFEHGLGSGQGAIGVFLDKTDDPRHANLRIERLVEHNTMVDPNATSYNINKKNTGAKWVIYEEWVDKEDVELDYPDKKADLEARGGGANLFGMVMGNIVGIIDALTGRRSSRETSSFGTRERTDMEVMVKSRYLVTHTWWKEPKKCVHWYDNRKSEIDSLFLCKDKEIATARKSAEDEPDTFSIEEVNSFVMHHTIRVRDTFLEDRVDELNGVQMFPVVFFWPYWVNGYKSGIAEDLIGTQEEINWTHSMALNLIKKIANVGAMIKEDSSGEYVDWLEANLGRHGIVLDKSKAGGEIEFLDPPAFPTFEAFTERAMNNVKTITGRLDLPERDPKALSGRAKFFDIQKTQQGSMSLMSNYNYTLAIFGDLTVDIIRKNDIFSEDEIREIVDSDDLIDSEFMEQATQIVTAELQQQGVRLPEPPIQPDMNVLQAADPLTQQTMINTFQQEAQIFQQIQAQIAQMARQIAEGMLIDSIHNMKAGKYSTKVSVSPMAETMRLIKSIEIFELQKLLIESRDVGLDGDDLIDATDAPDKDKLKRGRERKLAALSGAAV